MLFDELIVWHDHLARSGPENMAVDEALMRSLGDRAVLRIYHWEGDWVSLGYFQGLARARALFGEEPGYVRRWTGGGVVDHRGDLTYTLAIPRGHELAGRRGNESYCAIHREIAKCLGEGGIPCGLTREDSPAETAACFEKPVAWDLLGAGGEKLAGAGQRRSRWGVLHQGSVRANRGSLAQLGSFLGARLVEGDLSLADGWEDLVDRYASPAWRERVR
jgi:lipoate-protein ligase A